MSEQADSARDELARWGSKALYHSAVSIGWGETVPEISQACDAVASVLVDALMPLVQARVEAARGEGYKAGFDDVHAANSAQMQASGDTGYAEGVNAVLRAADALGEGFRDDCGTDGPLVWASDTGYSECASCALDEPVDYIGRLKAAADMEPPS